MCIRCNVPDEAGHIDRAQTYLDAFAASRVAMKAAADAMESILETDLDPEVRRRYDRTHKAMRRRMRGWNSLEELRERPTGVEVAA